MPYYLSLVLFSAGYSISVEQNILSSPPVPTEVVKWHMLCTCPFKPILSDFNSINDSANLMFYLSAYNGTQVP